jgi:hypothetical protein
MAITRTHSPIYQTETLEEAELAYGRMVDRIGRLEDVIAMRRTDVQEESEILQEIETLTEIAGAYAAEWGFDC